jgi:L-seryl-tRNA(Ser) seleniumtransferase
MKLDRQEIVGVVAAIDAWFSMNHEDRLLEHDRRMSAIRQTLAGVSNVRAAVVQEVRFWGSSLHVVIATDVLGKSARQVADELDAGSPRIWVRIEGDDTIIMRPRTLYEGEESIVGERLRRVLGG